jgi:gluconolactonase
MNRTAVITALKRHQDELKQLGIARLSLFGSTARDEARKASDVDVAVILTPGPRGFAHLDRMERIKSRVAAIVAIPARAARHRPGSRSCLLKIRGYGRTENMHTHNISRRRMLAMASAAGSLAITGCFPAAQAQGAKRIDQYAPELEKFISTSEPILELGTGFGAGGNTEGPVWWKEGGYLLFSEIGKDRRLKFTPGQGVTVARENTNGANGLTRDPQGRLVICEGWTRRVTREETDGSFTVMANSFQGRRLNKPNDVVVKSDGAIYFTDPWNIQPVPGETDLSFNGVYRISADRGTVSLLFDHFIIPNGLAFAPDESVLYVNDSRRRSIFAFDVMPNGMLAKQTERLFADLSGPEPGGPDGMKATPPATCIAAARAASGSSIPRVRSSAASCTDRPTRPTSRLAATTGRRSISPRAQRSAR